MLRATVVLLVLANIGYFVWSQGMLRVWGLAPPSQSEAQRLSDQVAPHALRVLSGEQIKRLEATLKAKPAAGLCLVAGPFDAPRSELVQRELAGLLPAQSWVVESSIEPARWMVYMGPYTTPDALAKKQAELRALAIKFEVLRPPVAQAGISLGSFGSKDEAERRLQGLPKGVRTARVVAQQAESSRQLLRVPAADVAQRAALEELATRVPAAGPFRPC